MIIGRYALINTRLRARKKTIQYRDRAGAAVVEPQVLWLNCCYHGRRPVVTAAGRTSSCAGETVTLSVARASRLAAQEFTTGRRHWSRERSVNILYFIFFRDPSPCVLLLMVFFVFKTSNNQNIRDRYCYWHDLTGRSSDNRQRRHFQMS